MSIFHDYSFDKSCNYSPGRLSRNFSAQTMAKNFEIKLKGHPTNKR